ncbi:hypothetical protein ACN081_03795 [Rothia sp. P13129]|uniref:hypothetical protein n=1 Tax=Rothia sp. P13129 TaxID=3402664 RepID=UPI003AC4E64C
MRKHHSSRTDHHLIHHQTLEQDTPEALLLDGNAYEEEQHSEQRTPAQPLTHCSAVQAVTRFYRFFSLREGQASASEFVWGMAWSCCTTLGIFMLTAWMHTQVMADVVGSFFRVLYMLMIYCAPAWFIIHIMPTFSLLRRFFNGRV